MIDASKFSLILALTRFLLVRRDVCGSIVSLMKNLLLKIIGVKISRPIIKIYHNEACRIFMNLDTHKLRIKIFVI